MSTEEGSAGYVSDGERESFLGRGRPSPRWRHRLIASCIMRWRTCVRHTEREEKGEQISQNEQARATVSRQEVLKA